MKYNHTVRVCSMKHAEKQAFSSASLRFIKRFTDTINCMRACLGTVVPAALFLLHSPVLHVVFPPMTHMLSIAAGPELGACNNPGGGGLNKVLAVLFIKWLEPTIESSGLN